MSRFSLQKSGNFSSSQLIVLVALYIALFGNFAFFSNALQAYPPTLDNSIFLGSLFVFLTIVIILILSALCHSRLLKPGLVLVLLTSAVTAYFMDRYGVIIDVDMIDTILNSDVQEARDLISLKLFYYVFFLGLLPSLFIYRAELNYPGHLKETARRLKLVVVSLALLVFVFVSLWANYASFFRVHKKVRYYANPVSAVYAVGRKIVRSFDRRPLPFKSIGADAAIPKADTHRELSIIVVGETARADHFSLNGYKRETNPRLKQANVVNFPNFWSCGTLTIDSVPCMFSNLTRATFSRKNARNQENVLDILKKAGVSVLWRDNNSSSKGVADRLPYQDFRNAGKNPVCDVECRDEGMLYGLQEFIDGHPQGDILVVLHQMGNHGPAYYKRYPQAFEKFTPVCKTNELGACTSQEINNAYDNAILYTDYFLSKVINLLKKNDDQFETSMMYVSDHGESLGENGIYLHGLPYFLAPDSQKHVPFLMWFGERFDRESLGNIEKRRKERLSHDNLFSTLIGLFEIKSSVYVPKMDILDRSSEALW